MKGKEKANLSVVPGRGGGGGRGGWPGMRRENIATNQGVEGGWSCGCGRLDDARTGEGGMLSLGFAEDPGGN